MKHTKCSTHRKAALMLAGLIALSSLTGCSKQEVEEEQDLTINVEAQNPEIGDLVLQNDFMGTISPEDTVEVFPKVQGEVTSVNFEVGDYVNEGDILFTIDDQAAQIGLAVAQAGAASAAAQVKQAEVGVANAELTEASTIDQMNNQKVLQIVGQESSMDSLDTAIKNAELAVKQAEINLNNLNDNKDTLKGRRNELDNALDEIDDALRDATDSAERAILNDRKAQLQSTRDSVKASQETLDDQIAAASMSVQQAKNNLAQAKENKANTQGTNLVTNTETDRNIASTTEKLELGKETAAAQASLAQASAETAAVNIEQAELSLSYYSVAAPISGIIQEKKVELHNNASAAQAAYVIVNQNSMTVTFNVSEDVRNTLSIGDELEVERNGAVYEAKITEIADSVDSSTGLFKIKGSITKNTESLASGVSVKVKAKTYSALSSLIIPYGAVYYEDGKPYVYVASDGEAKKTFITTGIFDDTRISVSEGLTEQDAVITTWSPQLSDGAAVRVVESKEQADAAKDASPEEGK